MSDEVRATVDADCAPGVRATGPPVRYFFGLLILETVSWSALIRLRLSEVEPHNLVLVLLSVIALTSYAAACRLAGRVQGPPRRHWAIILVGAGVLRLAPTAGTDVALWLAMPLDLALILVLGHLLVQQKQSPLGGIVYAWHPVTLLATLSIRWTDHLALLLLLVAVLRLQTQPRPSRALLASSAVFHPVSLGLWPYWWTRGSKWAWPFFIAFLALTQLPRQGWMSILFPFPFPTLLANPSGLSGPIASWMTPLFGHSTYSLVAAAILLSLVMLFRRRGATVFHAAFIVTSTWLLLLPQLHPQHLVWLLPWMSLRQNHCWWFLTILATIWLAISF